MVVIFLFFCFCFFFRDTLAAYRSSQARLNQSYSCQLTPQPQQCWIQAMSATYTQQCQIPDPLSKARDWTCILIDISQIRFCCAMMGIPIMVVILMCLWEEVNSEFFYSTILATPNSRHYMSHRKWILCPISSLWGNANASTFSFLNHQCIRIMTKKKKKVKMDFKCHSFKSQYGLF